METQKRTVVRTITFRILATIATVVIVFFFTGDWVLSIGIGIAELVSKSVIYYVHERAWEHVSR